MSPTLPPPVGELIDVGGHRLHIHATGAGRPTVVFEAGGAGWSMDWHLVQTQVAQFTRVCSYDRAGFGWSDPGPRPRTSGQIVKELHTLLMKARVSPPYILVGASFGGHTARLYTSRYPAEVAGIVLLDARHDALTAQMPPAWRQQETAGKGLYHFLWLVSRLGALPMLGELMGGQAAPPLLNQLPPAIRSTYLAIGFQPKYFQSNLDELAASGESDQQLSAAGSLGHIPLTVIRHGLPDLFARMPPEQAGQAERVWQNLQMELAKLSSQGRLLVAEKSGHGIQIEQPGLVVDAIRQIVEINRRASASVS